MVYDPNNFAGCGIIFFTAQLAKPLIFRLKCCNVNVNIQIFYSEVLTPLNDPFLTDQKSRDFYLTGLTMILI